MKKLFAMALVLCFAIAGAVLAHTGPETIVIKAAAKKQPPVTFAHAKHGHVHAKQKCDTCHHTNKGLTETSATPEVVKTVKPCSSCHLDPKDPKVPSMREMSLTRNPLHTRCITCHKEQKKGPTVCKDCHKK